MSVEDVGERQISAKRGAGLGVEEVQQVGLDGKPDAFTHGDGVDSVDAGDQQGLVDRDCFGVDVGVERGGEGVGVRTSCTGRPIEQMLGTA